MERSAHRGYALDNGEFRDVRRTCQSGVSTGANCRGNDSACTNHLGSRISCRLIERFHLTDNEPEPDRRFYSEITVCWKLLKTQHKFRGWLFGTISAIRGLARR